MIRKNAYDELVDMIPAVIMAKINKIIDQIQREKENYKYRIHCKKFYTLIFYREK